MLEPLMYTGGVYRHDELMELVEDLGGHLLQKNVMQLEVVLLILVPADDISAVEQKAAELLGTITRAPLIGTEIAVVAPSLAYHHMPIRRAISQSIFEGTAQRRISLAWLEEWDGARHS